MRVHMTHPSQGKVRMRTVILGCLLASASACVAHSTPMDVVAPPPGADATLHALEDQWADAYVHHDAAKLEALLGDDYIMTMNLGGIRSKDQYVTMVRTDTLTHQSIVREQHGGETPRKGFLTGTIEMKSLEEPDFRRITEVSTHDNE